MANDQQASGATNQEGNLDPKIDLGGIDDPMVLKAKLQEERDARIKEAEARRQLTARAKAAEDKLKGYSPTEPIIKEDASPRGTLSPSDILRADEFKLYRQGYTEAEIDLVMKNGGMEALKDDKSPLVLGLKVAHEQRRAEEAAASVSDSSGTSELERKYTRADLEKMKPSELEKVIGFAS